MSTILDRSCIRCGNPIRKSRGLCEVCYKKVRRLVRLGIKTWGQLEAEGKILPKWQSRRVIE